MVVEGLMFGVLSVVMLLMFDIVFVEGDWFVLWFVGLMIFVIFFVCVVSLVG